MNREEQGKKMGEIIARAWTDDTFKQRLLADATAVFREEGVDIPQDLVVRALENTDKVIHLVIPPKPQGRELSDAQLEAVAAGGHPGCLELLCRLFGKAIG